MPAAAHAQNESAAEIALNFATLPSQIILNFLATVLGYIGSAFGQMTLVLIESLIIPILGYNSFSTAPVIGLGWSLVRDVVNMFVIAILLVLAIFTIIGDKRGNWQAALPGIFLGVILVNFSRTICGFLIDISQVVMFTFVNALLDIAAGNFSQLFGLPSFGDFASDALSSLETGGSATGAVANFMTALIQIPLYLSIFAIMLILALAYLWRIVILWVLVILSPFAFFTRSVKSMFGFAGGTFEEWWKQFFGALMLGPLLTFFLWLALSLASSGDILASQGFVTPDDSSSFGFITAALDSSNITATLLALVFLIVGMQQSAKYANAIGGVAGQLINEKTARSIVGGTSRFAAGLGNRGAAWAARGVLPVPLAAGAAVLGGKALSGAGGLLGDGRVGNFMKGAGDIAQQAGKGALKASWQYDTITDQARALGRGTAEAAGKGLTAAGSRVPSVFGAVGPGIMGAGSALAGLSKDDKKKYLEDGKKVVDKMTDDERLARLDLALAGSDGYSLEAMAEGGHLRAQILTDSDFQKASKKRIEAGLVKKGVTGDALKKQTDEQYEAQVGTALQYVSENNDSMKLLEKGKLHEAKSKFAHLIKSSDPTKTDAEAIKDFVHSDDFVLGKLDPAALVSATAASAAGAAAVRGAVDTKIVRERDDGTTVTLGDEIRRGTRGPKLKKAIDGFSDERSTQGYKDAMGAPVAERSQKLGDALSSGQTTLANVSLADIRDPDNQAAIIQAVSNNNDIDISVLGDKAGTDAVTVKREFVAAAVDRGDVDMAARAVGAGVIATSTMTAAHFVRGNADEKRRAQTLAQGIVKTPTADYSAMSADAKREFSATLDELEREAKISPKDAAATRAKLMSAGASVDDVVRGMRVESIPRSSDPTEGTITRVTLDAAGESRLRDLVKADIANVGRLHASPSTVGVFDSNTPVTRTIVKNVTVKDVQKLGSRTFDASGEEARMLRESIVGLKKAIEAEQDAFVMSGTVNPKEQKRLGALSDAINETHARTIGTP